MEGENNVKNVYKIIGKFKCDYCQDQMVVVRHNNSVSVMSIRDYSRIIWEERRTIYKKDIRKSKKHRKNIERNRKSA